MNHLKRVWKFYYEGFRNMGPLGKKLWIIVLTKLFIMFAILRLFFFPMCCRKTSPATGKEANM